MTRTLLPFAAVAIAMVVPACASQQLAPAPSVSSADVYRLGSGDEIRVVIYGEDRLSGGYKVADGGDVSLPLIGDVKAAGLTIDELTRAITTAYGNGYLVNPRVAVQIVNYRPFFILGEVQRPGQYPFIPGMTVRQAIATANGYTYRAKQKVVFITRWGEKVEKAYQLDAGTVVMPGDTVRIPERYF